jgi:hypothetical protein
MKKEAIATFTALLAAAVADNVCQIVGTSNVNCRVCPYVDNAECPVVETLFLGSYHTFSCRTTGGTVNGDK